ncbi:MAG: hypothetical protein HC895_11630 [Leptolyngbyaceae cyanobacterium SM1_3_5]|nr:hypothetical protein [Leptolyngbyaceae cyanobacterium SM1_3_5]
MTMPKRRTPNYKKAAAAIEELGETPKEKKASPLEIFVSANYDRVIKAIENGIIRSVKSASRCANKILAPCPNSCEAPFTSKP